MNKTLIKGGKIVSMDDKIGVMDKGDVLIEDDKILEISSEIIAGEAEIFDASKMIIIPGLIDSHVHTWQTGIRGIAGNWTMGQYLRGMHANLATSFKPEDIYLGNLAGALTHINGGITTLMDWSHNNPTPEHTDSAIDGLEESGIRAVFGHGSPKPDPKEGQKHFSEVPHPKHEIERLRNGRLSSDDALVTLGMCILGPHYSTYEVTHHDILLAREYDLLASAHMSGGFNRLVPDGIYKMRDDKLLDSNLNIVHGNDLSDEELQILIDHGVKMTITPEVEIQMGFGDPIIGKVIACGGHPSIGVDVESNISGDMFNVIRLALQVQRMIDNKPFADSHKPIESLSISSIEALKWATIYGAEMMGIDHKTGSLTPGKQADITLVRADDLNIHPVDDPVNALVFYANASNVDTVYINGDLKKKKGKLVYKGLTDVLTKLEKSRSTILESSHAVQ
ncbi:MAG: amidohydrolase family protein [Pseudomonadota bacterium]|nr:amidohydrolase family protein [Pseudomonadota bacterium]